MAINGWTLILFFNFMILPKDLAVIIKCCNKRRFKFYFIFEFNEIYCIWNFLSHEKNVISNQGVRVAFWFNLPCS